jgi:F-type H+-transporting ATPase subunit a
MDITLTPDEIVYAQWGFVKLNATLVFSWVVMLVLVAASWFITRDLSTGPDVSRVQSLLEQIVFTIRDQIRDVANQDPTPYIPFIGALFLYIATANLLNIVPGYEAPTASLSTTAALATCVFFAVPIFGVWQRGLGGYLKHYIEPTPIMLPFEIISEFSRTVALAFRLFGNVMSGSLILTILLGIIPLFIPILLNAFEMLIGLIQAYIFAILAMVYISSAARAHQEKEEEKKEEQSIEGA